MPALNGAANLPHHPPAASAGLKQHHSLLGQQAGTPSHHAGCRLARPAQCWRVPSLPSARPEHSAQGASILAGGLAPTRGTAPHSGYTTAPDGAGGGGNALGLSSLPPHRTPGPQGRGRPILLPQAGGQAGSRPHGPALQGLQSRRRADHPLQRRARGLDVPRLPATEVGRGTPPHGHPAPATRDRPTTTRRGQPWPGAVPVTDGWPGTHRPPERGQVSDRANHLAIRRTAGWEHSPRRGHSACIHPEPAIGRRLFSAGRVGGCKAPHPSPARNRSQRLDRLWRMPPDPAAAQTTPRHRAAARMHRVPARFLPVRHPLQRRRDKPPFPAGRIPSRPIGP